MMSGFDKALLHWQQTKEKFNWWPLNNKRELKYDPARRFHTMNPVLLATLATSKSSAIVILSNKYFGLSLKTLAPHVIPHIKS